FDIEPTQFLAGTVGPPGQRVFYLQARDDSGVVTLRLEKQQVAALAEYLAGILADLPAVDEPLPAPGELAEPVIAEWVVGSLGVAYEETEDRVLIVAEELVPPPEGGEAGDTPAGDEVEAATARFHLTRAQVAQFVQHAVELVM